LDHPHTDPLSTAETQVALTFLRDFEKSGIHLPPSVRARFVEISDSLLTLGRTFLSYAALGPTPKPPIEIPDAERLLTGMGSQFVDSLPRRGDTAYVVPGSWEAQMIQRYAREGEARRLVYVGNNKKEPERVDVLETMLKERAELAGVLNKGNWSEVVLTDKMAKNPENVMGFLNSLAKHHKTYASQDVAILKKLKATSLTGNFYSTDKGSLAHLPTFNAWDRDFYSEKYLQSLSPSTAATQPISPYFSTGNCLSNAGCWSEVDNAHFAAGRYIRVHVRPDFFALSQVIAQDGDCLIHHQYSAPGLQSRYNRRIGDDQSGEGSDDGLARPWDSRHVHGSRNLPGSG